MTDPAGYPLWTRTSDYTTYGGDADKRNYQSQGAINPETDITAEQFMRLVEDAAECARTSAFAQMSITCNDTSPAAPTVNWARLATGATDTAYEGDAAPTGFPSASRNGTGNITIAFDATYTDAYGVSAAFTPVHILPSPVSPCAYVTWYRSGSNVILQGYDSAGNPLADSEFTVEVA